MARPINTTASSLSAGITITLRGMPLGLGTLLRFDVAKLARKMENLCANRPDFFRPRTDYALEADHA